MEMILKSNNEVINMDIVCSFETNDNLKYIVLTDYSKDEDNKLNIFPYNYEVIDNKMYLSNIKEEDKEFIYDTINKYKEGEISEE